MRGKQKFFSSVAASALLALTLFSAPTVATAVTTNLNAGESINLKTVIDNNMSVWIGDKVFETFDWSPTGLDLDTAASNVNVRAIVNPSDIGFRLEFQLPMTAGDTDFKHVTFEYTASVTNSPNLISDIHLGVTGATSGDAVGTVGEDAFAGAFFGDPPLVGHVEASLPGPPTNSVTILNYPVAKIWVTKDIIAAGNFNFDDAGEYASISTIEQTFSQIPEPSTALLVGLGLLGVVAVNRKRKS